MRQPAFNNLTLADIPAMDDETLRQFAAWAQSQALRISNRGYLGPVGMRALTNAERMYYAAKNEMTARNNRAATDYVTEQMDAVTGKIR